MDDERGCKADAEAEAIGELERLAHERGLCLQHCGGIGAFMDQERLVCARCLGDES